MKVVKSSPAAQQQILFLKFHATVSLLWKYCEVSDRQTVEDKKDKMTLTTCEECYDIVREEKSRSVASISCQLMHMASNVKGKKTLTFTIIL